MEMVKNRKKKKGDPLHYRICQTRLARERKSEGGNLASTLEFTPDGNGLVVGKRKPYGRDRVGKAHNYFDKQPFVHASLHHRGDRPRVKGKDYKR